LHVETKIVEYIINFQFFFSKISPKKKDFQNVTIEQPHRMKRKISPTISAVNTNSSSNNSSTKIIECPICFKQCSSLTIEMHVNVEHGEEENNNNSTVSTNNTNNNKRQKSSLITDHLIIPSSSSLTTSTKSNTTTTTSVLYVSCPICSKSVQADFINTHLDSNNCSTSSSSTNTNTNNITKQPKPNPSTTTISSIPIQPLLPISNAPPGLFLIHNFITKEEENKIVQQLHQLNHWKMSKFSGLCDSMTFGRKADHIISSTRAPDISKGELEIPDFLTFIIERFQRYEPLQCWFPNNGNANYYKPTRGDYLRPHYDDRQLSGEIIVNVSLLNDCIMTFTRTNSIVEYRVLLPRFSASLMTKQARWNYMHQIKNEDLFGGERISINFRQAP
jgi:alkylated DNA repair dioxygenase AlkB